MSARDCQFLSEAEPRPAYENPDESVESDDALFERQRMLLNHQLELWR